MDRDRSPELISMSEAVSEFEVVIRGYDRSQVRDALERIDADLRIALTDRSAAQARAADLASQLSTMHAEMESLRRKAVAVAPPTYETMGERISEMLRLAEDEAAEIRRTAAVASQARQDEAQATLEEARSLRAEAHEQAEAIRADARATADATVERARQAAAAMDEERDRRHAEAEADFDITLRARRSDAAALESHLEQTSRTEAQERVDAAIAEADERVAAATAEAERRVAAATDAGADIVERATVEAQRRVTEARDQAAAVDAVRGHALDQLREVRALLAELPTELDTDPAVSRR